MRILIVLSSLVAVGLCVGGWTQQDPTDQQWCDSLTQLASQVSSLSFANGCPKISDVSTQVVSGMNYKIRYEDAGKTCTIQYYVQSWTNTYTVNKHICAAQPAHAVENSHPMMGGDFQQDPTKAEYTDLLFNFTDAGLLSQDSMNGLLITKVATQVVAGINYKYTIQMGSQSCHLTLFVQSWTTTNEVTTDSCNLKATAKRQVGGWTNQDPSDQHYADVLVKFTKQGGLNADYANCKITAVQTQVVSGTNYKYTLRCADGRVCHLQLYEQTWTHTYTVTSDHCDMAARQLVGGWQPVTDQSDEGFQKCVKATVDGINARSNSMFRVVESNVHARYQVVKGIKYDITLSAVESTCMNSGTSAGLLAVDCPANTNSITHPTKWHSVCVYEAWASQPVTLLSLNMPTEEEISPTADTNQPTVVKLAKTKLSDLPFVQDIKDRASNILGGDANELLTQGKKLLGPDGHDLVDHLKNFESNIDTDAIVDTGRKLLGKNGQELVEHAKNLLGGGDNHDLVNHVKELLGKDGHNLVHIGIDRLLGGDGHDVVEHAKNTIGGDGHDMVEHAKNLIGGDGHDVVEHAKNLISGGGHDIVEHAKNLIGGDGHDMVEHAKNLIGEHGHDMVEHAKNLIGGGGHDDCHIGMFKDFKAKFNKLYDSPKEEEKRFAVFCDNMRTAHKLQETENGSAVYGATKFADLTKEEFKRYVGKKWDTEAYNWMRKASIPSGSIPDNFDWRDHGAVTPVKNQGSCGCCWAFSTTGNIEGQWAIKKNKLLSLSEQELVDCDKVDEGCNGGLPSNAYKEIERLGGLETETDYKYKGEDEKCHFNRSDVSVYINDSVAISSDEHEMAAWLVANGPISIGINAFAMQFYMGGISHPWKFLCNPKDLDHGVLIVGYGVDGSKPYWIVKNSWGPDWGEKGYYLVYRGAGVCGLNTMCTSAVVN
ncbi:uncharacterized protein LOC127875025 isoform X40 [Dreissena polymorpha]|uniref:uncharacterized protein LOC127875025 isoform X40 n=1 Tax=Dreissena polymorpha TaxID=45954 RepID=UPI002264AB62|nr:uncharacterized protein LOC127875025 isoform X40 [Dreissena polymorpha]